MGVGRVDPTMTIVSINNDNNRKNYYFLDCDWL